MSQHLSTVQAIYDAFARGDVPAFLSHLAPDVEWEHDWGGKPLRWFAPRRGRMNVAGFFNELASLEVLHFAPEGFLESDNQVAVVIRIHARVRDTGREIRDLEMHLWTFDLDGKVSRMRHFSDTHQFAMASQINP